MNISGINRRKFSLVNHSHSVKVQEIRVINSLNREFIKLIPLRTFRLFVQDIVGKVLVKF